MNKFQALLQSKRKVIGIWGYPNPLVYNDIKLEYSNCKVIDLDINYGAPPSGILPDAYCKIIRNIIDNAIALRDNLEVIVASVGEEKCDSGRFAAIILKDLGFNVVQTRYTEYENTSSKTPIAQSNLPLKEKIVKIMDGVIAPQVYELVQVKPEYGFWGVPPNDLSILGLFPDATHVYGWTRCVEANRPADYDLEMFVDEGVPTVFYAQTFCAKMQLAKYLAKKHGGLYVDVDDVASNSVKAKIEAFIKLG